MSEKQWIANIWDSERASLEQYLPEGASFGEAQQAEMSGLIGVYILPGTDMRNFWAQQQAQKWTSFGASQQAKMPGLTVDYTPTNLSNFGVAQKQGRQWTQEELEACMAQVRDEIVEAKAPVMPMETPVSGMVALLESFIALDDLINE